MTVGSFKARKETPCKRCKDTIRPGEVAWFVEGARGYWCQGCQEEWVQKNAPGSGAWITEPTTTMTQPQAQDAPRQSSNESDAVKGHRENMESAKLLRDVLANLTVAIITLRDALNGRKNT